MNNLGCVQISCNKYKCLTLQLAPYHIITTTPHPRKFCTNRSLGQIVAASLHVIQADYDLSNA